jgi:hypothetical protein
MGLVSVQQNPRSKPLQRPVVAFCSIESKIYTKATRRVVDLTAENVREDEDEDQDKTRNLVDGDGEFNLNDDVDLGSPLLEGMLSDRRPVPGPEDATTLTATPTHTETRDHEPTEDDWETL